tara:strand:- start:227 stop:598 length:372 start_codon:yes stop_codon:yes gene_type:complete
MAIYENLNCISLELNTGTIDQYNFVKISGADGQFIAGAAKTDICIGVAQTAETTAGAAVAIGYSGISKVVSGGTITRGGQVTCSSGKAVAAASTDEVHGVALSSAVADDVFDILLAPSSQLLA